MHVPGQGLTALATGLLLLLTAWPPPDSDTPPALPAATSDVSTPPNLDFEEEAARTLDEEALTPLTPEEADEFVRRLETIEVPFPDVYIEAESPKIEADRIYEAVFRYLFKYNASGLQRKARAYCLKIDDQDPSAAFLRRFAGHQPPIRPGSEFEDGKDLHFEVERLDWKTPTEAVIYGGYCEGALSASGSRFHLKRRAGRWFVEVEERIWISHIPQRLVPDRCAPRVLRLCSAPWVLR